MWLDPSKCREEKGERKDQTETYLKGTERTWNRTTITCSQGSSWNIGGQSSSHGWNWESWPCSWDCEENISFTCREKGWEEKSYRRGWKSLSSYNIAHKSKRVWSSTNLWWWWDTFGLLKIMLDLGNIFMLNMTRNQMKNLFWMKTNVSSRSSAKLFSASWENLDRDFPELNGKKAHPAPLSCHAYCWALRKVAKNIACYYTGRSNIVPKAVEEKVESVCKETRIRSMGIMKRLYYSGSKHLDKSSYEQRWREKCLYSGFNALLRDNWLAISTNWSLKWESVHVRPWIDLPG